MSKHNAHTLTIGFDISDKTATLAILDRPSQPPVRIVIDLTLERVIETFRAFPPALVVMEAGGQTRWLAQEIGALGHRVLVANPRRIPLLTRDAHKTDANDADMLARVGRLDPDLLSPVTLRSRETQLDLMQVHARDLLVKQRTSLINTVRGFAKELGQRLPECDADGFARKVVAKGWLPQPLLEALEPLLAAIASTTEAIKSYDRRIAALVDRHPVARHLQQVDGVGPITSLAYVLTLDQPDRFRSSRSAGAYLGLVPRQAQSGDRNPQLHITKEGNALVRKLLVQCAQHILSRGKACDLKRFGLRLAGSGAHRGLRKRAIVAVARKLAVLLHALWKTGEVYDPDRHLAAVPAA